MKKFHVILFLIQFSFGIKLNKSYQIALPKPEQNGDNIFKVDKNINVNTIDNYLNRDDSVYIDLRMLEDEAHYQNIGGDRFLSGFIKGFKVVPLPYIINVDSLPEQVGDTYIGKTLFTKKGKVILPNYEESYNILNEVFPKNKNIILMCGGGGYAKIMKDMLISLGWNKDKIYNIGGYWDYNGDYNIETKFIKNGKQSYNFNDVDYYNIDFNKLHKI